MKQTSNVKSYGKLLVIALVVFLFAGLIAAVVKTNAGRVLIREVNISPRGTTLSGMLYIPKDALETDSQGNYLNKRPAVLVSHGYLNSNQMQDPFAMELSRRGFVVLSMDMYGHGNSEQTTGKEDPDGAAIGARDFYDYLLTLPYVDHTRIGLEGHSMGGMNTGNTTALESGFYTLEDLLLIMLKEELGVEISAEDVAAQNPDQLAAELDDHSLGIYEVRKQQIEEAYSIRPKALVFIGSGPGFAFLSDAHVVDVAGHPVFRDLQANVGVILGKYEENPHLMFSSTVDGIIDASQVLKTSVARRLFGMTGDTIIEERTWYGLNLSSGEEQLQNTMLVSMDAHDYQNTQLRAAIDRCSARVFFQPSQEHVQNHFSTKNVSFVAEYFTTVMNYNGGELSQTGGSGASSSSIWLVKELANGVMLACLFVIIYALAALLLHTPFFVKLQNAPAQGRISKKDLSFWICAVLFVIVPAVTYIPFFLLGGAPTTYAGNTGIFSWSWFFSQEMSTRVGIWAFLNGIIDLVILIVKYLLVDKKKGISMKESLLLPRSGFFRSLLLGLIVFVSAAVLVSLGSFLFAYNDPRFWILAFRAPTRFQMISWLCYLPIFFVFYFVNSLVVNSSRMRDMGEGKNTALCAVINGLGIGLFLLFNFGYLVATGHLIYIESGRDYFLAIAVVMPMVATLPIAGILTRKLYQRTGNAWLGAIINTMLFTWCFVGNTTSHFSMFLG